MSGRYIDEPKDKDERQDFYVTSKLNKLLLTQAECFTEMLFNVIICYHDVLATSY